MILQKHGRSLATDPKQSREKGREGGGKRAEKKEGGNANLSLEHRNIRGSRAPASLSRINLRLMTMGKRLSKPY